VGGIITHGSFGMNDSARRGAKRARDDDDVPEPRDKRYLGAAATGANATEVKKPAGIR
jgi:hypothetical protein